jgi:hypothetical protein
MRWGWVINHFMRGRYAEGMGCIARRNSVDLPARRGRARARVASLSGAADQVLFGIRGGAALVNSLALPRRVEITTGGAGASDLGKPLTLTLSPGYRGEGTRARGAVRF